MKRTSLCFAVLMFAALFAQAQMPMPKPAPELKKLDYFVGHWTETGDMKPGPMGPGGKFMGQDTVKWMDGGFFQVDEGSFDGAMGKGSEVAYFGYDADKKQYTYNAFNSMGEHEVATGSVEGDTWNWYADENMGGQSMKGHYWVKMTSPNSYDFKFEVSQDGSNWTTVMDGKATKAK